MKNDKEDNLGALKNELNQKVESIMGPTPENPNTVSKEPERYLPEKDVKKATSAPVVKGSEKISEPPASAQNVALDKKAQESNSVEEESKEIDKAVDDIAEKEADEILSAEDEAVEKAFRETDKKQNWIKRFWGNKVARRTFLFLIFAGIVTLGAVPTSRYYILNTAGVRSSASLRVLDESTQQPLKNVNVTIGEASGVTNEQGVVGLSGVKLGTQTISIERRAYAKSERQIIVGWGSNPLGDSSIKPTGIQYSFNVVDYLSKKPIAKAEAFSGDASAFSDKDGKATLTLDTNGDQPVVINIRADGYRSEKIKDDGGEDTSVRTVRMVPAQKQVFITKRSGKYDVYKIDADGKNEELVLSGTGSERSDMTLAAHPTGNVAALVSTRDNIRSSDKTLLSTLTMIEVDTNKTFPVDSSERIQVVGWIGDRLIYVKVNDEKKKNGVSTHSLISYDYKNDTKTEVSSNLFFNDVMVANDRIYYAPAAEYEYSEDGGESKTVNKDSLGLFSTNSTGGDKQTIIAKEIWSISRKDYSTIVIGSGQDWYEFVVGKTETSKLSGAPAEQGSRIYIDSIDKKQSLWVDKRDGKGVLLTFDFTKQDDKILSSLSGLASPVRWLNATTAVFRIQTEQETADYAISTNGGDPQKITDVTATSGVENWYFY
ncbi:MAG TPA: hypothetical protein PKB09_00065 [Candidatus Saccharibacteria bacterium]|nr:hypothetical protein [Candidatus Saccharibacteria bacterium]